MTRLRLQLIGLFVVLLLSLPARAEQPVQGVELGARASLAIPAGKLANGRSLSDSVMGQLPLVLDVGYRIVPNLYVGLSFQYGIMKVERNATTGCESDLITCAGRDYRFGLQAIYHVMPHSRIDPWAGMGIGYEIMSIQVTGTGQAGKVTWDGFEVFNFVAGVDFEVTKRVMVGPVLGATIGRFSSMSVEIGSDNETTDVSEPGAHDWFSLGVRVSALL